MDDKLEKIAASIDEIRKYANILNDSFIFNLEDNQPCGHLEPLVKLILTKLEVLEDDFDELSLAMLKIIKL